MTIITFIINFFFYLSIYLFTYHLFIYLFGNEQGKHKRNDGHMKIE